jgi:hypothetical protein
MIWLNTAVDEVASNKRRRFGGYILAKFAANKQTLTKLKMSTL